MTIEVIRAGFGGTGTMSLKVALEKLGFSPCYHMTEVFSHPEHVEIWERAARGESVDWEEVFSDYRATTDWPASSFYEELMEQYPEAKVILTVRAPDRWYESSLSTIYNIQKVASSLPVSIGALFISRIRTMRRAGLMAADFVWNGVFDGRFEDRRHAITVLERWNEDVKDHVPPEKLLVYEVKEGWGPLCDFLGVEAPRDERFPHLNEGEQFRKMIQRARMISSVAGMSVAALAILAFLYLAYRLISM